MKYCVSLLSCLFLLLGFNSMAAAESNTDPSLNQLLADLEGVRQQYHVPAMGIVIIKNGKTLYADATGVKSITTQQPVDQNTMFRLGSISKTFAALAALKAQQLGLFSLEDEVSHYLGEDFIDNKWNKEAPVKIVHLLEHTAGLSDISRAEFDFDQAEPITLKDAFQIYPKSRTVNWKPGSYYSYSNLGAPIVAYIIEKQSGMSYEEFVKLRILEPLAMTKTSFFNNDYVKSNLVTGHSADASSTIDYWNLAYRPFGALNSSPKEMAHFLTMFLNQGRYQQQQLFSTIDLRRMQHPQSTLAADHGLTFGYGLGLYNSEHNGILLNGHGGTAAGHLADFRFSVAHQLAFMVAINSNNSTARSHMTQLVSDFLTKDIVAPRMTAATSINQQQLQQASGYFEHVTARGQNSLPILNLVDLKQVKAAGNELEISSMLAPSKINLLPITKEFYHQPGEKNATAAILQLDNQLEFIQVDELNLTRISAVEYFARMTFVTFVILIVLFEFLFVIYWLPAKLLGKLPGYKNTLVHLLPFITLPILILPIFISTNESSLFVWQVLLKNTDYIYLLLTLIGAGLAYKSFTWQIPRLSKANIVLTSISNLMISGYLLAWGII